MRYKYIFLLLITTYLLQSQDQQVVTFISPRSQTCNVEQMLAGWENVIHRPDRLGCYGALAFTLEATSSFRSERINQCLFGEDIIQCKKEETEWRDFIIVSGSQTENRIPQKDWLADYFGLPTDFKSIVKFRPRVHNFIFNTHFFFGLNGIKDGLYIRFELPFVYANWDLNIKESVLQKGTNGYSPGYFNTTGIERNKLLSHFTSFISGFKVPKTDNFIFEPLKNAKMDYKSRRLVRFSELSAIIGYDHFINGYHHMGTGLQCAAPCGNRPKGEYLFEPMIGNGHHWECGVELSAYFRTWTNNTEDIFTEFFFDAVITHLFGTRQRRSFDLKKSSNSRYILMQKLSPIISDNLTGDGITPIAQYAAEIAPVANITTFDINVSVNVQADIAFMYSYTKQKNSWSFGYSLWRRGCETITIKNSDQFPENIWALKGDAYLFGFVAQHITSADLPVGTPVALSATEHNATINSGTNFPKKGLSSDSSIKQNQIILAQRNQYIDNPQPAFAGNNQWLVASMNDTRPINQINTSIQPQFITFEDIDINSAATSGFSQKIFTHFNHKIAEGSSVESYLGIGAEIEFGRQAGPTPAIGADKCINCALSYWGMWLKGGISF
jgi:hypothetical protein